MKRKFLFIIPLLALFSTAGAGAETLRFPYFPTLTPDAGQIYFSYDGDVFRVNTQGGTATRYINLGGNENHPIVSPDGKYVTFSSDIYGNDDIFIVPVEGGAVKRLTWHDASDTPAGWSADSKTIYFESTRANISTVYSVKITGGTPVRLFEGYFNTVNNLTENPATGELYFNESAESLKFPTRKRYVGDHNPDIKSWNPATKEFKKLTDYEGKDSWPMADRNGNLYFVTDRYNKESNIAKYVPGGEPRQLTRFKQSVQHPSISHDGSLIVFLYEYKIMCLDPRTGKTFEPQITIADNNTPMDRLFEDQRPGGAAVSPDGKKLALEIRGHLFISDMEGKYLKQLDTPADERVSELIWTDNTTLVYTRTEKGYYNLFTIQADGSAPEKQLYKTPNNVQSLVLSHKKDRIAFISGRKDVMQLDVAKGKVSKLTEAEFWSFRGPQLNFSFDDSMLVFDAMHLFESDIYIYSFADKKLHNLTNSASSESSAVFSPDGKDLYFRGNLYSSSFPRGSSAGRSSLYRLPLRKYDQEPFQSDVYDKLFSENEKEKKEVKEGTEKEEKAAPIVIDYKDIYRRLKVMPGNGYSPYTYTQKGKSWLIYKFDNETRALEISDPEAEPFAIKGLGSRGSFTTSDEGLYCIAGKDIYTVDLNRRRADKVTITADLTIDLDNEFRQIFYESWAVMEQNFYDVRFHGADWYAKRDYYASFLPYVRTREHLRTLCNDLLGELNSSHLGFRSSGKEETRPQVRTLSAETGIIWSNTDPYTVGRILTDSPADNIDIDLLPGDRLVAVNGVRVSEKNNRESYLASVEPVEEIRFTFSRNGKEQDVKLHTIGTGALKNLLYTEWEDQCRARVDERTDGKVAYIHMRDMTDGSLMPFLMAMHTDVVNKDALILDLRYNNGGNVHKEVIDFLRQQEHFRWSYRDFTPNSHPNVVPGNKPIVVLVNERSLSDAEVTSNGIKTLGIAKIVGTETYRWIIFTSSVGFVDGSSTRMPAWGCYSLTGEDLEHTGVKPDIYVKNTFTDRLTGKDPQLDTAIDEILRQMK